MSSNQQIPVGIPVSQNPYPSLPYSQNFPDEPEPTENSRLQTPLNNHPQHYYPPQYAQGYGQQPPPMNQPGQFYGAPQGFNQQPQHIMVPVDQERVNLGMKIADIDKRLDSGWYFVFKIFLYLNIVGAVIVLLQFSISFLLTAALDPDFKGLLAFNFTVATLLVIIMDAWALQYSLVFKNALNEKSLEGAQRGLKSNIGNSIYYTVISIVIMIAVWCGKNPPLENLQRDHFLPSSLLQLVFLSIPLTLLWIYVMKKVVDLIAEREKLVQEANTRYGTNLA